MNLNPAEPNEWSKCIRDSGQGRYYAEQKDGMLVGCFFHPDFGLSNRPKSNFTWSCKISNY